MTDKAINSDNSEELARLSRTLEMQRIGNRAVRYAQEENRRIGIPNWYSINGVIISDQEIEHLKKQAQEEAESSLLERTS